MNNMGNKDFEIIFSCDIGENRQIVLSQDKKTENFVLAQCFIVNENGRKHKLFQKGSIIIEKDYISNFFANVIAITEIVEE